MNLINYGNFGRVSHKDHVFQVLSNDSLIKKEIHFEEIADTFHLVTMATRVLN